MFDVGQIPLHTYYKRCSARHLQECGGGCGVAAVAAEAGDGCGPRQMGLAYTPREEPALLVCPQLIPQPRLCMLSPSIASAS